MTQNEIQEISNALNDAAHWIRYDPADVSGAVSSVEAALEKLRVVNDENINAFHHPER